MFSIYLILALLTTVVKNSQLKYSSPFFLSFPLLLSLFFMFVQFLKDSNELSKCFNEQFSTLFIVAGCLNVGLTFIIILLQILNYYILKIQLVACKYIDECTHTFQNAINFAQFIRIPIAGAFVMGEIAGVSNKDVLHEYEKDSMERRALIYGLFGRNEVVNDFLNWPENKFLKNGYDGEEVILENRKKPSQN